MKKPVIIALAATAAVGIGWTALAWPDNSAQDAANYAAAHPVVTRSAPQPTVTVTQPAKPAPTVTTTTTQTVTSVPQSCLDALDYADQGFGYAGTGMQAASDGFAAVARGDLDGVLEATRVMKETTPKLTALAPQYNAAKAACRAAGGGN